MARHAAAASKPAAPPANRGEEEEDREWWRWDGRANRARFSAPVVEVEVVVAVVAFAVYVAEITLRLVEERESGWEDKESRCVRSLGRHPKN